MWENVTRDWTVETWRQSFRRSAVHKRKSNVWKLRSMIPVIDIFAGPGGLGEGFNALRAGRRQIFKTVLSIEKDKAARETLRLRSFFRQFEDRVPQAYYEFVRGALSLEELYLRYPDEVAKADEEAWLAELGNPEKYPTSKIDERIDKALRGAENWVLVGGPPCQAYSVVGRHPLKPRR